MVNAGLACLAHCCRMGGASACSFPIPFQPCLVRHRPVPYRTVPYRPYSHTAKQPHFSSLSSILLLSFDSSSPPSFLLSHLHRYPVHFPSPFGCFFFSFLFLILSPFLLLFLSRAGLVPAPNPTSTVITITRPCLAGIIWHLRTASQEKTDSRIQ